MSGPTAPPRSDAPLVSIVILNYNGAHLLRDELPSLLAQDHPAIEILVTDNGSQDDSAAVAESFGVRFLPLHRNLYFGAGNNAGAAAARGEFLFFVNNDMRFPPSVVRELVRAIRGDDAIFSCDIKQYDWEGRQVLRAATRIRRGSFLRSMIPTLVFDSTGDVERPIEVPYTSGAALFCRRRMFETLGGFDPTFLLDNEDLDLCWRAWLHGWKSIYLPDVHCFHKGGATLGENPYLGSSPARLDELGLFRRQSRAKNTLRFCLKTMSWSLVARTWLRQAIAASVYLASGRWRLAAVFPRAWISLPREWREMMDLRARLRSSRLTDSRELVRKFLCL